MVNQCSDFGCQIIPSEMGEKVNNHPKSVKIGGHDFRKPLLFDNSIG